MIKYNLKNVEDWYYNTSDIIKVYKNNAVCYYKITSSGGTPTYDLCYAVVDDISSYQDRDFVDVYNKADEKWYKLNNLNQYEEYGVYGEGRNISYYDGKLTIDGDYEYQYSGNSWVSVGEVSGGTNQVVWYDPQSSGSNAKFEIGHYWGEGYKMVWRVYLQGTYSNDTGSFWSNNKLSPFEFSFYSNGFYCDCHKPTSTSSPSVNTTDYDVRVMSQNSLRNYTSGQILLITMTYGNVKVELEETGTVIINTGTTRTGLNWYNGLYTPSIQTGSSTKVHVNSIQIYNANNELVNDLKFVKNNGVTGANEISMYDSVLNVRYNNTTTNTPTYHVVEESGGTTYPVYYDEKTTPLDNLTFNTLEDAEAYAYNNCVYDGMIATIGGSKYRFNSENGWVVVPEYYRVEDVTPNSASGWTINGSSTYNPDPTYYDDFDLETTSTSYSYKIAKVTIYGYDHFTYYLRAYHGHSAPNAYLMATNVDELSTDPTSMGYDSPSAITNTYDFRHTGGSAVNLSNYRRVTYNNLDKTVEHTFYVVFYGRSFSIYDGNATILIPKEQTNENWEQVTFSASTNVGNNSKNLYIDGNNSSSGGTNRFYYRWIIGLPSGSHASYTNYSNYGYCPDVTSSTFTSVAGNSRQVDFTYITETEKNLTMRPADGNGNVLTPSNNVYYTLTRYNSCGNSSTSNGIRLPSLLPVKVGGSFKFSNYNNQHYIYGYALPDLTTTYYSVDYTDTFNLVYTKLNDEAVTVTYSTYDPNDVETPTFSTDITWPYNGGSTATTAGTSFDVPYTYSYTVSQASDSFSAASQTYTAGQASRTITFVLYPNNREFASVADMEAYQYAWEGMKATVNGTKYVYENGEWVEKTYKEYEYIRTQNASGVYYNFNTNFYPSSNNTFEVKIEFVDTSVDWGAIINFYNSTICFEFDTVTGSYQAIIRTGGSTRITYRPTIGANNPTVFTLPLSGQSGTYSINGGSTQTIQYNYSPMTLPPSNPMGIFGSPTGANRAAVAKLYYLKVYDGNGNLIKHYVPSDNNGTPCLYEIVDGDFILDTYTGSNHGTLTLGPQI